MRGVVMYGPGDVRVEERDDPRIELPTDAVIRLAATCVCGSDLWSYRGIESPRWPVPMGHEYCGVVEQVGSAVATVRPGQFVVGSFFASDNTCEICQAGYQSGCIHREAACPGGAQAQLMRVPLADGTLVATPGMPDADLIPSLLAASDVLGTGQPGGGQGARLVRRRLPQQLLREGDGHRRRRSPRAADRPERRRVAAVSLGRRRLHLRALQRERAAGIHRPGHLPRLQPGRGTPGQARHGHLHQIVAPHSGAPRLE